MNEFKSNHVLIKDSSAPDFLASSPVPIVYPASQSSKIRIMSAVLRAAWPTGYGKSEALALRDQYRRTRHASLIPLLTSRAWPFWNPPAWRLVSGLLRAARPRPLFARFLWTRVCVPMDPDSSNASKRRRGFLRVQGAPFCLLRAEAVKFTGRGCADATKAF